MARKNIKKRETAQVSARNSLANVISESVMFGLFLFSIVLMISSPQVTGFSVLNLPVNVNIPLVLGVIIFIVDIVLIEKWFRRH